MSSEHRQGRPLLHPRFRRANSNGGRSAKSLPALLADALNEAMIVYRAMTEITQLLQPHRLLHEPEIMRRIDRIGDGAAEQGPSRTGAMRSPGRCDTKRSASRVGRPEYGSPPPASGFPTRVSLWRVAVQRMKARRCNGACAISASRRNTPWYNGGNTQLSAKLPSSICVVGTKTAGGSLPTDITDHREHRYPSSEGVHAPRSRLRTGVHRSARVDRARRERLRRSDPGTRRSAPPT
jgi:hypothetical protein